MLSVWHCATCVVLALVASVHAVVPFGNNDAPYQYKTKWFQQNLDHFAYNPRTFSQRYLINDTWWNGRDGPIFFYTGNEGDIELFAQNTGFLWEIAPEFGALVVFAEHRYYGESLPYGENTWSNLTSPNLYHLTSEQALADYAVLLRSLKANLSTPDAHVVSFGGSYGGMLSAWIRLKYPSTISGAIAASAPVLQLPGITSPKVFNHIITEDFEQASRGVSKYIYQSWQVLERWASTPSLLRRLNKIIQPCSAFTKPSDITNDVFNWYNSALGYMAMADYPYPASFLGPMPANPINYTTRFWDFATAPSDVDILNAMYKTVNVFYNFSGQAGNCFNVKQLNPPGLRNFGWPYQSCTEMVFPIGQYGMPNDFFYYLPWDYQASVASCQQQFGVTPDPTWIKTNYGGLDISAASNIVFTNGNRDPWSGGGFSKNVTGADTVIVYTIQGGAHHLDLRSSNPLDPPSVIEARNIHRRNIKRWIGWEE